MPKLWNETIEAHRLQVRDAILDTTATLAAEHGPASVTMSQVAEAAGIGRATLYKYFPGVDEILRAWHERQVGAHLEQLVDVRDRAGTAAERLEAVLAAYARIHQERVHGHHGQPHGPALAAFVHGDAHVAGGRQHLHDLVRDLVADAAEIGDVRDDVAPSELAAYCLHALEAASTLRSRAAVRRLVEVTLAGLRRP